MFMVFGAMIWYYYNKTTQVCRLCGNITVFGVADDHMSRQDKGDLPPPKT